MLRLFLLLLALLASSSVFAADCRALRDFEKTEGQGKRKYVDVFNFRKDHRGDSVLMLFKDGIEKGQPPKQWLFVHRPSSGDEPFCVLGRGAGFGQHDDRPDKIYGGEFGEGHVHCATTSGAVKAPDALRAYALRQLGEAIVLYTEGLDGPGFQFAIGPDHDWIIIQDNDNQPQTSCLFDAGTDVLMRFNITVPTD